MAIARVTTAKAEPANTPAQSAISTGAFVATAGNLIIVFVRSHTAGTPAITSITDTAGNTYVLAISALVDPYLWCYYAKNILGHATNVVTVNFSPSAEYSWAYAAQYSGLNTIVPLDVVESKTGTGVTDIVSDPISTAQADELVIAGVSQTAFTTFTAGVDFTLIDGSVAGFGGVEERITTSSLSSYTVHVTSGATSAYTFLVVSFKQFGNYYPAGFFDPLLRPEAWFDPSIV